MNDDDFTRTVKQDLRRLVEGTSPEMRARLDRMVDDAVQGRTRARGPLRNFGWPVGAVAATVAAATMGFFLAWRPDQPAPLRSSPVSAADDVALLLNVDNFDLLEQMEFYQWLDRQPGLLEGDRGAEAPST